MMPTQNNSTQMKRTSEFKDDEYSNQNLKRTKTQSMAIVHSLNTLSQDTLQHIALYLHTPSIISLQATCCSEIYEKLQEPSFWSRVYEINNRDHSVIVESFLESTWFIMGETENGGYDLENEFVVSQNCALFRCGHFTTNTLLYQKQSNNNKHEKRYTCDRTDHDYRRIMMERSVVARLASIVHDIPVNISSGGEVFLEPLYVYNDDPTRNFLQVMEPVLKNGREYDVKSLFDMLLDCEDEEQGSILELKHAMESLSHLSQCISFKYYMYSTDYHEVRIIVLQNSQGSFMGLFASAWI